MKSKTVLKMNYDTCVQRYCGFYKTIRAYEEEYAQELRNIAGEHNTGPEGYERAFYKKEGERKYIVACESTSEFAKKLDVDWFHLDMTQSDGEPKRMFISHNNHRDSKKSISYQARMDTGKGVLTLGIKKLDMEITDKKTNKTEKITLLAVQSVQYKPKQS